MNQAVQSGSHGRSRTWIGYVLMLALAAAAFAWIQARGTALVAPPPATAGETVARANGGSSGTLLHVLLALAVILVLARAAGALFRRIRQPPVIGEVLVGIALGPSLFGALAPAAQAYLLPAAIQPYLGVIAQIGVILFMFSVGLELDPRMLKSRAHVTIVIAHASIVVPFLLGSALALWLYPRLSSSDVPFNAFTLFLGVSMAVTAFPVLARILNDRGMQRSRLGVLALTCAAVGDVSAWCLLAFVVSVVRSEVGDAFWTFGMVVLYVAVMLLLVRPLIARLVARHDEQGLTQSALSLIMVGLLLSALCTEWIGVHALFGAFLFGSLIPHDSHIAQELIKHVESLVLTLFLPAFFAFTGLHTSIGLVSDSAGWLWCGAIIVVASVGKFGGCYVAARATGFGARDAAALGVLMNTRGLMELIVLNVGLELGVVTPTLFAMLLIMALVTTLATSPLLERLRLQPD
jgi:Kef-type K+ transport system membrane component KefB